jgi:GNAT superfamily N-acetyltransferase
VREPQRDARQGRRLDVPAAVGGVIDIRELTGDDAEQIGERLPLARLGGHHTYLVAWDGNDPVGHAHVAWAGGKLGVPEIQDVFVRPERRRQGVASELTLAAERLAAERGNARISLSHGVANEGARLLYEGLGYRDAGLPPERVVGTVLMRGRRVEVDDTLIYLVKELPVDSGAARSS